VSRFEKGDNFVQNAEFWHFSSCHHFKAVRASDFILGSSVLALNVILTDTKKKVWFSGHVPRRKLKAWYSGHIPRCQVVVLDQMRSATIGLLLHVQLTECTSNIDLAIRNPFRKVTFQ